MAQYAVASLFDDGVCTGNPILVEALAIGTCRGNETITCISDFEFSVQGYDNSACSGEPVYTLNYLTGGCEILAFENGNVTGLNEFVLSPISCGNVYPPLPLDTPPSQLAASPDDPQVTSQIYFGNDCDSDPDLIFWFQEGLCAADSSASEEGIFFFSQVECSPDQETITLSLFSDTQCVVESNRATFVSEACVATAPFPGAPLNRVSCLGGSMDPDNTGVLVGSILGIFFFCLCLIVLIGVLGFFLFQRQSKNQRHLFLSQQRRVKSTDIPLIHEVVFGEEIGKGSFGVVYRGKWNSNEVALKSWNNLDDTDTYSELRILNQLRHPNVVTFYGLCAHENNFYIVTELMNEGDLLNLLRCKYELRLFDLTEFALQIACGMSYLHTNNIIHRDLACRNILASASESKYSIKVADFGLSRKVENFYSSSNTKIPIRWTAPEAIREFKFSNATDVWSFGIALWEILNRGSVPFAGHSNEELIEKIPAGLRLPGISSLPPRLQKLVSHCLDLDPSSRPTFDQISEILQNVLKSSQVKHVDILTPKDRGFPVSSSDVKSESPHVIELENLNKELMMKNELLEGRIQQLEKQLKHLGHVPEKEVVYQKLEHSDK